MMKYILFSIIVPVYNVEDYLIECVESVLKQKFMSCEIILVDDGSTDSSGDICDKLANQYNEIRVIHQQNAGLSAARNTGIKNSKGEYLVFLDSDDLLYENSLHNLAIAIRKQSQPDFIVSRRCTFHNGPMTVCQYTFTDDITSLKDACGIYEMLQKFPDCWLGVWIFSVKRQYCLEKGLFFFDGLLHEDEEWVPRLFFNTDKIGFNNEILYCNRVEREGSITATLNIKREFDKLRIINLLHTEFQKSKYPDEVRDTVRRRMQKLLFGIICDARLYKDNKEYGTLLQRIFEQRKYMKTAQRPIYKLTYQSIAIFGIDITCRFLALINSLKKR